MQTGQYRVLATFLGLFLICVVGFQGTGNSNDIANHLDKMCADISSDGHCRTKKLSFLTQDSQACYLIRLGSVSEVHDVKIEWMDPWNRVYDSKTMETEDPGTGYYYEWYRISDCMPIAGTDAEELTGEWTVRFFVDRDLLSVQHFTLKSSPPDQPPSEGKEEPTESFETGEPQLIFRDIFADEPDGAYHLSIEGNDYHARWHLTTEERNLNNVKIETKLRVTSGKSTGGGGLIIKKENEDLYLFILSADGYISIKQRVDGDWSNLMPRGYSENANIAPTWNTLAIKLSGGEVEIFVNGELQDNVKEISINRGSVAVAAITLEEPSGKPNSIT